MLVVFQIRSYNLPSQSAIQKLLISTGTLNRVIGVITSKIKTFSILFWYDYQIDSFTKKVFWENLRRVNLLSGLHIWSWFSNWCHAKYWLSGSKTAPFLRVQLNNKHEVNNIWIFQRVWPIVMVQYFYQNFYQFQLFGNEIF